MQLWRVPWNPAFHCGRWFSQVSSLECGFVGTFAESSFPSGFFPSLSGAQSLCQWTPWLPAFAHLAGFAIICLFVITCFSSWLAYPWSQRPCMLQHIPGIQQVLRKYFLRGRTYTLKVIEGRFISLQPVMGQWYPEALQAARNKMNYQFKQQVWASYLIILSKTTNPKRHRTPLKS